MRAADVALQFYTVGGDAERFSGNVDGTAGTYRRMGILWSALPDDFVVVGSLADLELVLRKEKWGIVLTIEGAGPVGYELSTLENLYHLGLRSVCLTWFRANQVGDGVGESRNAGLTSFGRRLIAKLDELNMIIDVSQSSERTVREVLEVSGRPLIASHSNAAGVYPHVRNLPDDVIREIGARGGVVGLTTYPAHVGRADVGLDDFIDHIIHVCEVAGENVPALGLNIMAGSDAVEQRFLGAANIEMTSLHLPQVRDLNDLPCLVDALAARGVSEKAVAAICFGNVVRVLRESL
jgi:membrane dipeptidase